MPTYQYACTECGEQLEAVQSFSEPALTECPNCRGKLRKVFNSVGIVFKGSGFYRNDSRSGSTSSTDAPAKKPETTPSATPGATSSAGSTSTAGSTTSSTPAPAAS